MQTIKPVPRKLAERIDVIPAPAGWFILSPQQADDNPGEIVGFTHEPILAWRIESVHFDTAETWVSEMYPLCAEVLRPDDGGILLLPDGKVRFVAETEADALAWYIDRMKRYSKPTPFTAAAPRPRMQ